MSALGARSNNSERTPSYKSYLTLRELMALNRFRKNRWIYGNRGRWRRIQNIQDLVRRPLVGQFSRQGRQDQTPILLILLFTARLVMLPLESYGYGGRESIEHVLWEELNWFDKYLKKP
jgi:hypothetical protein